jgi:4-hydroxy-tetrahydrodipicolinate reductase
MNLLVLGKGKTGSLVIEIAQERGHSVRAHDEFDNVHASMLTPERLKDIDVVVDFTTPATVVENVTACVKAGTNIVVGTTGWYDQLPHLRELVEKNGTGFLWGANFSLGVNLFFEIAKTAAAALRQGYIGHITEAHHVAKKDAPSGTAIRLADVVEQSGGPRLEITSIREGDVFGMHMLTLDSAVDTIVLKHDAKSRRGLAEGAVRASEWLKGKRGFYDFKDIFREV